MEASAVHLELEPEPRHWQRRALWVGARLWCGSISFFFVSFVFAYFYLKSLDTNHGWKIGHVTIAAGIGVSIAALQLVSAVALRLSSHRRPGDQLAAGVIALLMGLTAVALQFYEYTILNFGAASGGYASVFFGWTSMYAIFELGGLYWIETQVATMLRARRNGGTGVDHALAQAGFEACSFYWAYFVAIGVLAYVILYIL